MFRERLRLSSELYHTEVLPLRAAEIHSLIQKTGNSFWLWRRRLYVGFYSEECEEGPTCLHYQIRADGLWARSLLHFGKSYLQRRLKAHAHRLFFFALWNTGRTHPDLAGWEHASHEGLLLRFLLLDPSRIQTAKGPGNASFPVHVRCNLLLQKYKNFFITKNTRKEKLAHRYRRVLIHSWLVLEDELRSILPPPFLPGETSAKHVRLYSLQAYDAGPFDPKSRLSRFRKGRERELRHCLLAPVFCLTTQERHSGLLPLWQTRTRISKARPGFRPFTASLNFYKNFIRMDVGDFKHRLLARAEFVPERGLGADDPLPAPLVGATLRMMSMDPESLALKFQDYETSFALNRVTLLQRACESATEAGWEEFWKALLGISVIEWERAWLVAYLDLRLLSSEAHDLYAFQYRPHPARAKLPHSL